MPWPSLSTAFPFPGDRIEAVVVVDVPVLVVVLAVVVDLVLVVPHIRLEVGMRVLHAGVEYRHLGAGRAHVPCRLRVHRPGSGRRKGGLLAEHRVVRRQRPAAGCSRARRSRRPGASTAGGEAPTGEARPRLDRRSANVREALVDLGGRLLQHGALAIGGDVLLEPDDQAARDTAFADEWTASERRAPAGAAASSTHQNCKRERALDQRLTHGGVNTRCPVFTRLRSCSWRPPFCASVSQACAMSSASVLASVWPSVSFTSARMILM